MQENQTFAKYRVIREIGSTDLSTVYLGHDPFIDRPVAIKMAKSNRSENAASREIYQKLFFNEAHAAGMLKHPNITSIFDAGVDSDDLYIVMEYVPGEKTLENWCQLDNLLPIRDAVSVIYKIAMALDYAHKKQIIHRDIKPNNILLTDDQEVKLTDFGIAMVAGHASGNITGFVGSPQYMSPEQIEEKPLNQQTDLFSLGIVMYELLTGKHPFEAKNLDAISHRITEGKHTQVSDLRSEIPEVLERIINRALDKDLSHRYKSGLDMAGDLSLVFDFLQQPQKEISRQEKFDAVKALDFFQDFSDKEIWELINASIWQHIPKDEDIILEGQIDKSFYIIIEGGVNVHKGNAYVDVLQTGDCFGEMGFISGHKRTATITAKTDVTIMKVQAPLIERASVNCQLRFHKLFLYTLIERLAKATDRIAEQDIDGTDTPI